MQKVHETSMASLRPNAFHDLESRLSAVRQILDGSLNLPQEDPDMTSLLEDMKKICATEQLQVQVFWEFRSVRTHGRNTNRIQFVLF